jgi:hypothetical protein
MKENLLAATRLVVGLLLLMQMPFGSAQEELETAAATEHDIRQIEIQIGNDIFVADLLWEKAPRTTAAIVSILPYEGITYHQFWSGQGLQVHDDTLKKMGHDHGLWPTDNFPDYSENPSIFGSAGEVGFYVVGHGLFLTYGKARFYGPPEGVEPTYIFAKISDNLDRFYELGRHIGRHGQQKIMLRAHTP